MAKYIVGIDEVGRGPLAGPVTVAAVALPELGFKNYDAEIFKGIKDSKKLSPKKRAEWYIKMNEEKVIYSVSSVSNSFIDKNGITKALKLAVERCLIKIHSQILIPRTSFFILLDGSLHAPIGYEQETIVRGDEKIPLISAASIIAKVTRDRLMAKLAKKYPVYGFENHKGYGTRAHRDILKIRGLCDIHRRSYCANVK